MNNENHEPKVTVTEDNSIQIYSNALTITPTPFDFQIKFATQTINPGKHEAAIKELCTVFLSPQHAKVFSQLLQRQIAKYEEENGEISIPASINQPVAGAVKQ